MDIKAELRLIREKCPIMWKVITQLSCALCPNDFKLPTRFGGCSCDGNCKLCWDKAIEEETE